MKRILRSAGALLVCTALFTPAAQAYLAVYGNGTATATAVGTSYSTAPTAAAFWKPTGDFYVGLAAGSTNNYAVSWTNYRTPNTTPALTAIGSDATLSTAGVGLGISAGLLKLAKNSNNINLPTVVTVAAPGAAGSKQLRVLNKTNTTVGSSGILNDSANAAIGNNGIIALTAGSVPTTTPVDTTYAAVLAAGGGNFLDAGSGIAGGIITVNTTTSAASIAMCDMRTGQGAEVAGGRAYALDATAATGIFAQVADATNIAGQTPAIHYDPLIGTTGTLFVGVQVTAANAAAGDRAIGIGFFHPSSVTATTLALTNAAPAFAIANTNVTSMFVTSQNASVSVLKLKTMHTSTGLAYIIMNGGNGLAAAVGNTVYAIPVVNGTGTAADGTPAKVSAFTNGQYQTQATVAGDLYLSTTPAVQVGNGVLPCPATTAVSDMYVDGDCVYVAIAGTPSTTLEAGIYSSQACFNSLGQIDHWTDWRKVVPNDMGRTNDGSNGSVEFVSVDSYTGHVFATSATTNFWTNVTQWAQPTATPTTQPLLVSAVNTALGGHCYSVVDLNSSVTGWGHTNTQRITAFGGQEQVCFAVTGSSAQTSIANLIALSTSTGVDAVAFNDAFCDYTNAGANILLYTSSLPAGAGAVVALGYSAWDADTTLGTGAAATGGFFLAGCAGTASTPPGLYVYAASTGGAGICPTTMLGMGYSNTTGFPASFSWQKVTNVSGMPIKIQSQGGGLHVLTRSATIDRIYSTTKAATLSALNNSFVVTASTGAVPTAGSAASSLTSVSHIYDFVLSVSATASVAVPPVAPTSAEQLIMLTNDGIYTTSSQPGMQTPSTQLAAGWVRIDASSAVTTQGLFADYFGQPNYTRNPQTVWFADFSANATNTGVYNQNIMYQLNRVNLIASAPVLSTYAFDPSVTATFDGATSFNQTTAPVIYQNFPVLYRLFYNDGARRFFIQKNSANDTQYQVLVLPYNLYDYNITTNGKAAMADTVVAAAGAFYWAQEIGSTGRLMMGTSNGVIALQ